MTSPATKSKLMRLKLDDLKTICAKLGITEKSKKADYTAAIMDALAVPRYPAATVDAAALQRHASSHPSATPKASSLDAYHGSGDDEEHDTMPHAASETSGENVLGTSVDHADRSWDEGSVWSDEGDGSGDDDVWGPGRGASELDPGAVERARLAMQAALEGTTDSDMHYVDPLASTARSTSMSPRSGPQMHVRARCLGGGYSLPHPTSAVTTYCGNSGHFASETAQRVRLSPAAAVVCLHSPLVSRPVVCEVTRSQWAV